MVGFHKTLQEKGSRADLTVKSSPLQTRKIDVASDLVPFLGAWRELTDDAPMRSPEWLLGWWTIYAAPGDELFVLLFHNEEGALVGLAPLYLHDVDDNPTFRLLGSGDVCTNHTTWFSTAGWEARVGIEVARYLLQCRSRWKRLLIESVDNDDISIYSTVDYMVKNGCFQRRRFIANCWRIALPASWDEYLMMLSRSLRKKCRKLQRQFFDTGKIHVHQTESEADLQRGFDILLQLHSARWGSAEKPLGVFDDERFRRFHETVSRDFLTRKKLRLAWLEHAGTPIAVEYQFFNAKEVYAYQAGVDLTMDEYSPGKLSMIAAIQFAIERGCESFDLLRGDEPYKANWRAAPTPFYDLHVWQDGIMGRLEWAMWGIYQLAVRFIKPIIPSRLTNIGFRLFHTARQVFKQS